MSGSRRELGRVLLVAAVLLSTAAAAEPVRWGVCPIVRIGAVTAPEGDIERAVIQAAPQWPGVRAAVLLPASCPPESGPIAEAGRSAGVDRVLLLTIEQKGDATTVRVRAVVVTSESSSEGKHVLAPGADVVGGATAAACDDIIGSRCTGSLRVAGPRHARLFVDGQDLGELPFHDFLPIGSHRVVVMMGDTLIDPEVVSLVFMRELSFIVDMKTKRLARKDGDMEELSELPLEYPVPLPAAAPPTMPAPTPSPSAPAAVAVTLPPEVAPSAPPAPVPAPPAPEAIQLEVVPPPTAPPPARTEPAPSPQPVPAAVALAPAASPPVRRWMRPTFIASTALAGVLVVTGTVSGIVAQTTANGLNAHFADHTLSLSDEGSYGTVHASAGVANVAFPLAGVAAIAAAVLYLVEPSVLHAPPPGSGADEPWIRFDPTLSLRGSF